MTVVTPQNEDTEIHGSQGSAHSGLGCCSSDASLARRLPVSSRTTSIRVRTRKASREDYDNNNNKSNHSYAAIEGFKFMQTVRRTRNHLIGFSWPTHNGPLRIRGSGWYFRYTLGSQPDT